MKNILAFLLIMTMGFFIAAPVQAERVYDPPGLCIDIPVDCQVDVNVNFQINIVAVNLMQNELIIGPLANNNALICQSADIEISEHLVADNNTHDNLTIREVVETRKYLNLDESSDPVLNPNSLLENSQFNSNVTNTSNQAYSYFKEPVCKHRL